MTPPLVPTLETERLTLCATERSDLPAYVAFYQSSDTTVGSYRGGRSDSEIADILTADVEHWRQKGFGMFLLRTKSHTEVLGGTGSSHPDDWPSHELTWWLLPNARGQGYATEASLAVIRWACGSLGWSHVETHMRDENQRAHAVARRLGGRKCRREVFPDGVVRDVYSFSSEEVVS